MLVLELTKDSILVERELAAAREGCDGDLEDFLRWPNIDRDNPNDGAILALRIGQNSSPYARFCKDSKNGWSRAVSLSNRARTFQLITLLRRSIKT